MNTEPSVGRLGNGCSTARAGLSQAFAAIENMPLPTFRDRLFATRDGGVAYDLISKIANCARSDRDGAILTLLEYAKCGRINHVRSWAISEVNDLLEQSDKKYADQLQDLLNDRQTVYWGIEAVAKVLGRKSFVALTEIALKPSFSIEQRAQAIRTLALASGQKFIQGLPSDPGEWTKECLPIEELKLWRDGGYKRGPGFRAPKRHPNLDSPKDSLDRIAKKIDDKLARLREKQQDLSSPTNWLTPASANDLKQICAHWSLPDTYRLFHKKYSPLNVTLFGRRFPEGLRLYGAGELISAQNGYAFNPLKNRAIADWPNGYVVIGDVSADPYVLDIGNSDGDDAPVLKSQHGLGKWQFKKAAATFFEFLESVGKP